MVDAQDASEWADRLIEQQGSVGRVLTASPEVLARIVDPVAVRAIAAAYAMMITMLRRRLDRGPLLANWEAVQDYLHGSMAHRLTESARVLHLDTKNMLVRDEQISEGSIDQTVIHVREVARRALELGSAAVILVHNHPSGDPSPSRQDIALTREMVAALKPLGIRVHDHLIIGMTGYTSFREQSLI